MSRFLPGKVIDIFRYIRPYSVDYDSVVAVRPAIYTALRPTYLHDPWPTGGDVNDHLVANESAPDRRARHVLPHALFCRFSLPVDHNPVDVIQLCAIDPVDLAVLAAQPNLTVNAVVLGVR